MSKKPNSLQIRIEPWADSDIDLLRLTNAAVMTEHLGGPETEDQILARHDRYLKVNEVGTGRMFSIISLTEPVKVGTIGYWERVWNEETAYEMGWAVLPPFQGRGVAAAATVAAISSAKSEQKHRWLYAFPSVDNPASNAICRKLGFLFITERDFEYPKGSFMRCNEWRLDLTTTEYAFNST